MYLKDLSVRILLSQVTSHTVLVNHHGDNQNCIAFGISASLPSSHGLTRTCWNFRVCISGLHMKLFI